MGTSINEDYIPFGEEWKKEMSKFPKAAIIEMFAKKGQETDRIEQTIEKRNILISRIWLLLSAHPDNEPDSEFADMISSIEDVMNNT